MVAVAEEGHTPKFDYSVLLGEGVVVISHERIAKTYVTIAISFVIVKAVSLVCQWALLREVLVLLAALVSCHASGSVFSNALIRRRAKGRRFVPPPLTLRGMTMI